MRAAALLVLLLGLLGEAGLARAADAPAPVTAPAAPRIEFDTKEIHFGKIVPGAAIDQVYRFRNAGTAELVIHRVKPSCGCTAALLTKTTLAPGESGEVQVRLDSGDKQPSFQDIRVLVFSNDALEKDDTLESTSVLHLRGEVANILEVMPPVFYFRQVQRGTPAKQSVTVVPTDVPEIHLLGIEPSSEAYHVTVTALERNGHRGFSADLEIAPDAPLGKLDGRVLFRTDHPGQPLLRVAVFGHVAGKIAAFPDRLQLFGHEGEKDPSIHLMRVAGAGPIELDGIDVPPFLEATPLDVIPGNRIEIALKLKAGLHPGPFAGVVRVFVRDAEQPLFEVPVIGEVPRRVTIEPPAAWLGAATATATLRISGAKVRSATAVGAPVTATLDERGGLTIRVAPGAVAGPFSGVVRLATDAPAEGEIDVPVRGVVDR